MSVIVLSHMKTDVAHVSVAVSAVNATTAKDVMSIFIQMITFVQTVSVVNRVASV